MKTKRILPKLMFLLLIPVVLGMGGLILSTYMQARTALVDQIKGELNRLADLQSASLDSVFRLFIDIADNLSRLEATTNLLQAVDTDGSEAELRMYRTPAQQACEQFVKDFQRISSVGLLDINGIAQAHSVSSTTGRNYSDRSYYKKVMQTGKPATEIVASRTTGAMTTIIAVPIFSQFSKNKVIGVTFAGIDMADMAAATVNTIQLGQTGSAFALDSNGILILAKPDRMGKSIKDLPWGQEILRGQGGTFTYEWDGLSKLAAYHKVPTMDFTLVVAIEWAEVMKPLTALGTNALILAAVCLLFTCLLIYLGVRTLTRPLSALAATAQRVAEGDWGLDPKSMERQFRNRGELETMFHAFCSMLATLKEKIFYYESILDSIAEPLFVTDINMRWVFINKAGETLLNRSRASLIGSTCTQWGSTICGTSSCGITCLRNGNGHSSLLLPQTQTSFDIQTTYITNLAGEKIGHIEVIRDVTEVARAQRKAENAMREGMLAAAAQLEDVVGIVSSASTELAAQIELSEQGAAHQAVRMSETAQAMEAMNQTVHDVTQTATHAADMSVDTRREAEEGAEVVRKSVASIQAVQTQALQLKQDMATLDENARSISQIMNVISDIADQTNLLALNAAIEAARAGDAGRGFAVVADEVRKLAEKTMTSTADVGRAVNAIQTSTAKSVGQMDVAVKAIEESTEYANLSGEALKRIVGMVDNAAHEVRGIASATTQQSATTAQISSSITEVNTIATDTAHAMLEASRAVSDLSNQAHALTRLIDDMKQ